MSRNKITRKIHKLMHSSGLIEEYTNLKTANRACMELNERYGTQDYWIESV